VNIIMCILLVAAIITKPSVAGFIFVIITVGFSITLDNLDGMLYYPTAAFADLTAIMIIALLDASIIVMRLLYISIISIFLNVGGWLLWLCYVPPTVYNGAFILLYIIAIAAIIAGNTNGLRMVRVCFRRFGIHRFNFTRFGDSTKGGQ
jgi:hypothetical protein